MLADCKGHAMHCSIGVGSRGARGAVAPVDFWFNFQFGKHI